MFILTLICYLCCVVEDISMWWQNHNKRKPVWGKEMVILSQSSIRWANRLLSEPGSKFCLVGPGYKRLSQDQRQMPTYRSLLKQPLIPFPYLRGQLGSMRCSVSVAFLQPLTGPFLKSLLVALTSEPAKQTYLRTFYLKQVIPGMTPVLVWMQTAFSYARVPSWV